MSGIINSINSFTSYFGRLYTAIINFFSMIGDFFSSVFGILQSLRYGATTLFTGVNEIINDILSNGIFSQLLSAFEYISYYIGAPATYLIASFLMIAIIRIGIAFVFKMLRMNIDYRTLIDKNDRVEKRAGAQHKK